MNLELEMLLINAFNEKLKEFPSWTQSEQLEYLLDLATSICEGCKARVKLVGQYSNPLMMEVVQFEEALKIYNGRR